MGSSLHSVCVFCGSERGDLEDYAEAARRLGAVLARRGVAVVYGGGNVGLMKELADAVLAEAGQVIGVIPAALVDRELAHGKLSDLRVVASMHERKALMADLSDAFVVLPGGLGTLEEMFEVVAWAQLRFHEKPCGLLNVAGYYDSLLAFLDHAVASSFLRQSHRDLLIAEDDAERLLERLTAAAPRAAAAAG
jgi:uncharacterized protein (TIGR00730 family)